VQTHVSSTRRKVPGQHHWLMVSNASQAPSRQVQQLTRSAHPLPRIIQHSDKIPLDQAPGMSME
jgi:hypothetical protein